MSKRFKLESSDIKPIAVGYGSCIASDRITVDGKPVGFAYLENPSGNIDSGWRFLAGDEGDDYIDNADNFEIYDINTIANYDPAITQLLNEPKSTEFIRDGDRFVPSKFSS